MDDASPRARLSRGPLFARLAEMGMSDPSTFFTSYPHGFCKRQFLPSARKEMSERGHVIFFLGHGYCERGRAMCLRGHGGSRRGTGFLNGETRELKGGTSALKRGTTLLITGYDGTDDEGMVASNGVHARQSGGSVPETGYMVSVRGGK
ncbi:MAG: hypothetical protein JWM95_1554 [Gemmatimonadetes bacterium]|nr:hypothetical protein [Gemmatimonadota bacterium]